MKEKEDHYFFYHRRLPKKGQQSSISPSPKSKRITRLDALNLPLLALLLRIILRLFDTMSGKYDDYDWYVVHAMTRETTETW